LVSKSAQNANRCTFEKCFDFSLPGCYFPKNLTDEKSLDGLLSRKVYVYTHEQSKVEDLIEAIASPMYSEMVEEIKSSRFFTDKIEDACIFIPDFGNFCLHNDCNPVFSSHILWKNRNSRLGNNRSSNEAIG
jgi:hypothetical protein